MGDAVMLQQIHFIFRVNYSRTDRTLILFSMLNVENFYTCENLALNYDFHQGTANFVQCYDEKSDCEIRDKVSSTLFS